MDFKDKILQFAEKVIKLKDSISTEEATKNAFVMPFIQILGYDVFNPLEVVPEYVTDVGTKKGEKIDYAILKNGEPSLLIECKHWKEKLDLHDGQLLRYYHVSNAKFGILTNGIHYRFYADLVKQNVMDEKPFLEFDITDLKEYQIEELKKFHKSYFNVDLILSSASELKYRNDIKNILTNELKNPSEEFVKFFINRTYDGNATEKVVAQFTPYVKHSSSQVISEFVTERLKAALNKEKDEENEADPSKLSGDGEKKINTTMEEVEAYYVVKGILRNNIDPNRITYRDSQSYFATFLDDNNRKPICRLYFNGNKKHIALLYSEKKETRHVINSLDDIYQYSDDLKTTCNIYSKEPSEK